MTPNALLGRTNAGASTVNLCCVLRLDAPQRMCFGCTVL